LQAKVGHVVIPARIVVGVDGTVVSVERRLGASLLPIPYQDAFIAGVRDCVRKWHFSPARIIDSDVNPNTGVGPVNEQLVEMSFDIDFVFDESAKTSTSLRPSR